MYRGVTERLKVMVSKTIERKLHAGSNPAAPANTFFDLAAVAELVDALVSGTSGATRGGSNPLSRTKELLDEDGRFLMRAWRNR